MYAETRKAGQVGCKPGSPTGLTSGLLWKEHPKYVRDFRTTHLSTKLSILFIVIEGVGLQAFEVYGNIPRMIQEWHAWVPDVSIYAVWARRGKYQGAASTLHCPIIIPQTINL